jgi:hypothetical protein
VFCPEAGNDMLIIQKLRSDFDSGGALINRLPVSLSILFSEPPNSGGGQKPLKPPPPPSNIVPDHDACLSPLSTMTPAA